jgi:CRP/FNR family transcriptional regulator, anaerobic regulatory protein
VRDWVIMMTMSSPPSPLAPDAEPGGPPYECEQCPLRAKPCFTPVSSTELQFIDGLKQSETMREAGSLLISEGDSDAPLYTILSGWAFRFKSLPDGRRQILTFLMAGDFIGLQQKLQAAAGHGVLALTRVRLCVFARDALWKIHREIPSLGYDVTWLAARHESLVDENLLSVGRRTAAERIASLLLDLTLRAAALDEAVLEEGLPFPLTQVHVADALGLSLVHTNRHLRGLEQQGLIRWLPGRRLHLPSLSDLAVRAGVRWPITPDQRPLI